MSSTYMYGMLQRERERERERERDRERQRETETERDRERFFQLRSKSSHFCIQKIK